MLRTLCVANQKGGVGKSTVAVNLAACLAERGQRVLLVDLDSSGATTNWVAAGEVGNGLMHVLVGNGALGDIVVGTRVAGVDLVPGTLELHRVEEALRDEPGREMIFREAVRQLPPRWDVLIADTPPDLGLLTDSALVACRELLIPCEASVLALGGISTLMARVKTIQRRLNPDLSVTAILPSRIDTRKNLHAEVVAKLREMFGDRVLTTVIRENVRVQEAPGFGQAIIEYSPDCAGAEDFRAVALEIMARAEPQN